MNPSPTYELMSRDRLFFDQYEFNMRFKFLHSRRMSTLSTKDILESCHWANTVGILSRRGSLTITDQYQQKMLDLAGVITALPHPYKRVVYSDWQYFYTNHEEIFAPLAEFDGVYHVSYHRAVIDKPRDTVCLQHSNYKWRSYFREKFYTKDQISVLRNFLLSRPEQFCMSLSWRNRWQLGQMCYLQRSNFVDHHDEKDVLLLAMAMPGCIRKTVPIVSAQ